MLERWTLMPSPTARSPRKYTLLVKGDRIDIYGIIKQLGAMCGRPQKPKGFPEFNYSLALRDVSEKAMKRIEQVMSELSPSGRVSAPAAKPAATMGAAVGPEAFERASPREDRAAVAPPPEFNPFDARSPVQGAVAAPPPAPAAPGPPGPAAKTPPGQRLSVSADAAAGGAALSMDPTCTFDSLIVGHFNRFAHAASMAVVSNPGTMYNPLFLYGMPGAGKSHFLMAIGRSIQEQNSGAMIFFTTGARLAYCVRKLAAQNKLAELQEYVKKTKALMIDDVHLMFVGEDNQQPLLSILNHYFTSSKHVALSSVYPPRSLGSLEEMLNFRISSGWSVEMKTPNNESQQQIAEAALARNGLNPDPLDVHVFLEGLGSNFNELGRWIRRLRALSLLRSKRGQATKLQEMMPHLFIADQPLGPSPNPEDLPRAPSSLGRPANNTLALFYPNGEQSQAEPMVNQFYEAARKNGIKLAFANVVALPYDAEQIQGFPFSVSDECEKHSADSALVLGPPPNTALASREAEMSHAVEHILRTLDIRVSWIALGRCGDTVPYFHALLDFCA